MRRSTPPALVAIGLGVLLASASVTAFLWLATDRTESAVSTVPAGTSSSTTTGSSGTSTTVGSTTTSLPDTTTTTGAPLHPWVDRRTVGQPWGDQVVGLLTHRGNPTHTYHGEGPVPASPATAWRYPASGGLCGQLTDFGVSSTWCGNGWTGQPAIWESPDGVTELISGAYDGRLHFVNAVTGEPTRTPLATDSIVKGSPTLDPDGFPLVYFGSTDGNLRIAAFDRGDPVTLWAFATPSFSVEGRWNTHWDSAPLIVNDIMFEGGENSIYYIWKLNRRYDAEGLVTVAPELLFKMKTWDDALLTQIQAGCSAVNAARCTSTSVESTTAMFEGRIYFGTSAGRVIGLDITDVENGNAPIVFDYWVGDDVDGSIVIDEEGMLYVPVEWKRFNNRGREVGQLVKLDPYTDGDPRIWGMESITDPPAYGGVWGTPVLGDGVVYVLTNKGNVVAVDRDTGAELWFHHIGPSARVGVSTALSSPILIGNNLLVAGYEGLLYNFDVTNPRQPELRWEFRVGASTLEATPVVWKGMIYLFSRDGALYGIEDG
ncbi:MAG: PQQ-binding-like beta-propeller repeat protein [Acidimicrobiia bacterium]